MYGGIIQTCRDEPFLVQTDVKINHGEANLMAAISQSDKIKGLIQHKSGGKIFKIFYGAKGMSSNEATEKSGKMRPEHKLLKK